MKSGLMIKKSVCTKNIFTLEEIAIESTAISSDADPLGLNAFAKPSLLPCANIFPLGFTTIFLKTDDIDIASLFASILISLAIMAQSISTSRN